MKLQPFNSCKRNLSGGMICFVLGDQHSIPCAYSNVSLYPLRPDPLLRLRSFLGKEQNSYCGGKAAGE